MFLGVHTRSPRRTERQPGGRFVFVVWRIGLEASILPTPSLRFNPSLHQRPRSRRQQVRPGHVLAGLTETERALLLQTREKRVGAVIDILFDLAIKECQKCAIQEILARALGRVPENGAASPLL